jgi:hypothetical protein
MSVGSAKHQIVAVAKVNQAGIAFGIFHNQRNDSLQNLLQTHIPNHEPADFLEKPELLLDPLQAAFEVFCLRHGFIIV